MVKTRSGINTNPNLKRNSKSQSLSSDTKSENVPVHPTIYYKITNIDENHNGYQYKDGLNILDKPFEKEGSCVKGGLYFTTKEHLHHFYNYGEWIREITIPMDAQIVQDTIKYRADKIILGKRTPLYDLKTNEVYPWLIKTQYYFNCMLCWASYSGNLEKAEYSVINGANKFEGALMNACKQGHLEIANWCVKKGANDFDIASLTACKNGQLEMVKWCIEKGANNLITILEIACKTGHLDIADFCIVNGVNECNYCHGSKHINLFSIILD